MLPVPTVDDLAEFTGRDVEGFSGFAEQALTQAALVFSIVTKREALPEDDTERQLAVNAMLEMADKIYLEQPFAAAKASPFSSETVGSWSYTKTINQARKGEVTGLFWWDLAVEELSLVSRSLVASESIKILNADIYTKDDTGESYIIGPADYHTPEVPFDINAERRPRDSR